MAYKESYAGRINRKLNKKLHVVEVAAGRQKADLVLKNATYVNVFCNQLSRGDIAVAKGLIAGMGGPYEGEVEVDMRGKLVLPGFVDAHIHLESSLVSPKEFAKAVLPHGTTTVITDPHEIANVMGTDGIEYMLQATEDLPLDVLKLDAEFFRGEADGRSEVVVSEAIRLAKSLEMRIVAEGVEKKEQVDFLAANGCDMIQGFYFAKPMPIADFEKKHYEAKEQA